MEIEQYEPAELNRLLEKFNAEVKKTNDQQMQKYFESANYSRRSLVYLDNLSCAIWEGDNTVQLSLALLLANK